MNAFSCDVSEVLSSRESLEDGLTANDPTVDESALQCLIQRPSSNGKRDNFTLDDLLAISSQVRGMGARGIIAEVRAAVVRWPEIVRGVAEATVEAIRTSHRLYLGVD